MGRKRCLAAWLAGMIFASCGAHGDDLGMSMTNGLFLVSPMAGWNRNEVTVGGRPGTPPMELTDTAPEYALFAMYVSPHIVANNILFATSPNDTDVTGDIAYLNVYGDPEAVCTWNIGGGYLWHKIDTTGGDMTVSEPIARLGCLLRWPSAHMVANPYAGYGWQEINGYGRESHEAALLFGIVAEWRWRMLIASGKYYRTYNRDRKEWFDVVRLWGAAMFNRSVGVMARVEYSEEIGSRNTSCLLGPLFAF